MPRGIYSIACYNKTHPDFNATEHQLKVVEYFARPEHPPDGEEGPYKGLLLYHKLGSGKTCTAIMTADKMLKNGLVKKVFVLTPGSLRQGWVNEYCNICGLKPKYLKRHFTFLTYNYTIGKKLPDFTDSLVIIDEVHNLVNGIKNRSKTSTAIYNSLMLAKCRVLALSGTPIYNYVYEFAILGNLLKPGEFPNVLVGTEIDSGRFLTLFKVAEDGSISPKNPTTMKHLLKGIISYYAGAGSEFVPEIFEEPIVKVVMTPLQEVNYWSKYIQEKKLAKPPSKRLFATDRAKYELIKRLYIMAKKRILTRAASNFYYPPEAEKQPDVNRYTVVKTESVTNEQGESESVTIEEKIGWITKKTWRDGSLYKEYSTKFTALLLNLILHNDQKHVLFTFFKNKSGVNLLHVILKGCGIKSEIFSGDLDDSQRQVVLSRFNSAENKYGEKIRLLLVTEAGAEGISVLNARHMHILESSPRINKTIQAIGRVARFLSHQTLPPEERNIKVWRYWSVASPEAVRIKTTVYNDNGETENIEHEFSGKEKICVDEQLYKAGKKTLNEMNSFLQLLESNAI